MVVGTHYMPFIFLYGMRQYAVLAATLMGGGVAIGLLLPHTLLRGSAWQVGLERLFANPASTTGYLFYFGFLGERLLPRLGRWPAALLLALLYTLHELSNPEYWYGGTSFVLIFFGILIIAALYLWRRNVAAFWLGDGLGRFASRLF